MTGPLAQQIAQVWEALQPLGSNGTQRANARENIVLALPDHGGRCGGTDEKPAALDQSDRFANPCIRCRVLLAFDAALPAREKGTE